jgi:translocation and assembly module TamB
MSSLTASGDADLKIEGAIPLVANSFVVDELSPLRASAKGEVQTGFLGGLFLPPTERIRGRLDVDFRVQGPLADLAMHGAARAEKISFTSATIGMSLKGAAFEVRARGSSLELTGFKAEDGQGGTLTAGGHVDFVSGDGRPEYALEAKLDKLRLINLDELNVTAGGTVYLSGRGRDLELTGKLTATSADLQLPESLPPDVVVIEVTHVNRSERFADSGAPRDVPLPIVLDLELYFPGRVSVHAPGLISEWRGEVFVKGTTEAPEVNGELKLIRGTISAAGVRFRLTEGRFVIDADLSVPEVDLIAEASRNDIKAVASIRGPVNDPTFELTSEPPLPEDEILSRLLFGTTAGNLTPVQSVQLAQAVARFSGLSSGNDPLYMLQRQTGIDRVEIKSGDDGEDASISLGKYLTDRVFVSIDQGLTGNDSIARVEVELTDHLAAQTEVGQDATAGVGIQWRISY